MKDLLTNLTFWTLVVASFSFLFSAFNLIVGKIVAFKIQNNELKHLEANVEELQSNEKEYRTDLKKELQKIHRKLGKIEKVQFAQREICNERHNKK